MTKFENEVKELIGYHLSAQQLRAFAWYEKELITWNERINLTAIREPESIRAKHFLDSLSCARLIDGKAQSSIIDIGTGAGFPGIPLKIIFPHLRLTLVDSIGKKVEFCRHVVNSLGLKHVTLIKGRAEDLGSSSEHREKYDYVTARAVANLNTLAEYMLPLVCIGGSMIALKGESGPVEAQSSESAITLLGGHLKQILETHIPGIAEERYLIVVDKTARTPDKFPRRIGVPLKRPIT